MHTFTCPHCIYQLAARAKQAWHRCPNKRTRGGQPALVPLERQEATA